MQQPPAAPPPDPQQQPPSYAPPPPGYAPPPMPPMAPMGTPGQPQTYRDWLRVSPWWQKLLVVLPFALVFLGGLIGGLVGIGAAAVNYFVMRSSLSSTIKVLAGVGVIIAAAIFWVIIAGLILALLPSK